jgi:hypothetical protein
MRFTFFFVSFCVIQSDFQHTILVHETDGFVFYFILRLRETETVGYGPCIVGDTAAENFASARRRRQRIVGAQPCTTN